VKELRGQSIHPGTVIATAARLDPYLGVNGVSVTLLEEGMKSLRKRLEPSDYPEAVILCDNLAMGLAASIPGVSTIGYACRSDAVPPGFQSGVPCVVGLPDLMEVPAEDVFIILDGDEGLVFIDPDVQTLVHYQQRETARIERNRVAIDFQHIPVKTAHGITVYVFGMVRGIREMECAIEQGADGLLVDMRECEEDSSDLILCALETLPGKPVWVLDDVLLSDEARSVGLPSSLGPVLVRRMAGTEPSTPEHEFLFSVSDLELVESFDAYSHSEESEGALRLENAVCIDGASGLAGAVGAGFRAVVVPGEAVSSTKEEIPQIGLEDFE